MCTFVFDHYYPEGAISGLRHLERYMTGLCRRKVNAKPASYAMVGKPHLKVDARGEDRTLRRYFDRSQAACEAPWPWFDLRACCKRMLDEASPAPQASMEAALFSAQFAFSFFFGLELGFFAAGGGDAAEGSPRRATLSVAPAVPLILSAAAGSAAAGSAAPSALAYDDVSAGSCAA